MPSAKLIIAPVGSKESVSDSSKKTSANDWQQPATLGGGIPDSAMHRRSLQPHEDFLAYQPAFDEPPQAAHVNGWVWPLIPVPDSWYAAG